MAILKKLKNQTIHKYLKNIVINSTKEMKELYNENFKTLKK